MEPKFTKIKPPLFANSGGTRGAGCKYFNPTPRLSSPRRIGKVFVVGVDGLTIETTS